jgi:hypothetical protein
MQNLLGKLALVVTILSGLAGVLETVNPKLAVIVMAVSGAISAFTKALVPSQEQQ